MRRHGVAARQHERRILRNAEIFYCVRTDWESVDRGLDARIIADVSWVLPPHAAAAVMRWVWVKEVIVVKVAAAAVVEWVSG